MDVAECLARAARAAWAEEMERATANGKRTHEDKRLGRQWYREAAKTGGRWAGGEENMGSERQGEGSLARALGVASVGLGNGGVRMRSASVLTVPLT